MADPVIGCVWHAWRRLCDEQPGPPSYAWCEAQWAGLKKRAPENDRELPEWLYRQLAAAWALDGAV